MSARTDFVEAMTSLLGMPVVWGGKGPDAYDCSGSVTACLLKVGAPDMRHTHNAQALANETRVLGLGDLPLAGDLVFLGEGPTAIEHVMVYTGDGGVISADGATSHITSLEVAMANPANRVRPHSRVNWRKDIPFLSIHRNLFVDQLDAVTR